MRATKKLATWLTSSFGLFDIVVRTVLCFSVEWIPLYFTNRLPAEGFQMRKHNTRLQARLDEWLGSFRENNLQATNIIDSLVSCPSFRLQAVSLLL